MANLLPPNQGDNEPDDPEIYVESNYSVDGTEAFIDPVEQIINRTRQLKHEDLKRMLKKLMSIDTVAIIVSSMFEISISEAARRAIRRDMFVQSLLKEKGGKLMIETPDGKTAYICFYILKD